MPGKAPDHELTKCLFMAQRAKMTCCFPPSARPSFGYTYWTRGELFLRLNIGIRCFVTIRLVVPERVNNSRSICRWTD